MNCQELKKALKETENRPLSSEIIELFYEALESGMVSVAQKQDGYFTINNWVQEFLVQILAQSSSQVQPGFIHSFDKIPLRVASQNKKYRQVPGAIVRRGTYIGEKAVLMPSFVNIGAHVGEGTMIDTWATVGSCAYIGKHCHISGGTGIGGVLEPVGSQPVIIEDHVFIGARSEIAEGVHIGYRSVLASGVFLTKSTKIYNKMTGEIFTGKIPPNSVVVPGSLKLDDKSSVNAAIIIKMRDKKTDSKVSLNEALRHTL